MSQATKKPAPVLLTEDGSEPLVPVENHELPQPYDEDKRRFEDE